MVRTRCAGEPHDGFLVWEDADDIGPALDLLVQPLQRICRMRQLRGFIRPVKFKAAAQTTTEQFNQDRPSGPATG